MASSGDSERLKREEAKRQTIELKKKALGRVYIDHGGDLREIGEAIGVEFKDNAKVRDANDFAQQFLSRTNFIDFDRRV